VLPRVKIDFIAEIWDSTGKAGHFRDDLWMDRILKVCLQNISTLVKFLKINQKILLINSGFKIYKNENAYRKSHNKS